MALVPLLCAGYEAHAGTEAACSHKQVSGRAQGPDGVGAASRRWKRQQIGEGWHPGTDSSPPAQASKATTPVSQSDHRLGSFPCRLHPLRHGGVSLPGSDARRRRQTGHEADDTPRSPSQRYGQDVTFIGASGVVISPYLGIQHTPRISRPSSELFQRRECGRSPSFRYHYGVVLRHATHTRIFHVVDRLRKEFHLADDL